MSLWGTNALRWALYSCTLEIPIWYLSVKKIFQEQRKKMRKRGKVEMKVNIWRGIQLKNFFLSPFFSLVFFISFSLLYFRSRSCNGFTTLCFLLIVIFLDMNGFDTYFQFMGPIFFSYRKQSKRTCHDVISISSESMGDYLFLSRLSNFAEENNIGLQTLARNDQEWSNFIRSFGSTSTIETSRSKVNFICIHVSESYLFTLTMTNLY